MKNKIYSFFVLIIFSLSFFSFTPELNAATLYCTALYSSQSAAFSGQGNPRDGSTLTAGFGWDLNGLGGNVSMVINWGDGDYDTIPVAPPDSPVTSNWYNHVYKDPGTYTVSLNVQAYNDTSIKCSDSFKVTVNVYGCTNPLADNYNSNATKDDNSCVITPPPGWYNLNFNVRDQNNSPRRDALVTIGQNFGNGTTRYTDGAGFANFGIPQNNNVNYTVSDSGCTTVSGSRYVGTSDQTVNVSMNCTTDDGGGNPPPPGPQPAVGTVESANCTAITGAAGDPDNWGVEIGVYLFSGNTYQAGGTYVADVMTNIYRPDVNSNFGITGNHGFSIPYPDSLRDNVARNFYVHPRDLGDTGPFTRLYYPSWGVNNVITLQCPPPVTPPVINDVSISAPTVIPNGTTQYTITHSATDAEGGNTIGQQYALINHMGSNPGQYKGYLTWSTFSWTGHKDNMMCDGNGDNVPDVSGGYAAIQSINGNNVFGHDNIELDSCSTIVSGTERTTKFVVRFNPSFSAPIDYNSIAGFVYSADGSDGWKNYANFGLYMPPPTGLTLTCPAPGTTLNATWSSPSPFYNTFYYRASTPSTDWTGNVDQSTITGTSKSIASVPGQTYNVWVHTRHPSDPNFYSSLINQTVTCGVPVGVVPTVTATGATSITTTGVTLGGNVTSLGNPASVTRGTCWGSANPPLTNCTAQASNVVSTGAYTHVRTGMTPGTPYWYRAYAENSTGRAYSASQSFTTLVATPTTYSLSVSVNPGPGGSIRSSESPSVIDTKDPAKCPNSTPSQPCVKSFPKDSTVVLRAIPTSSYWKFYKWTGSCNGTSTTCNLTLDGDKTVEAKFIPRIFIYKEF